MTLTGIKRIVYNTYQAVSGAGSKGIHDLQNGILDYAKNFLHNNNTSSSVVTNNEHYKLEKFQYPIFNNCLPHIDVFLDNGYTKEEEKMINETRKILGKPNLPITATAVRVPVFNCHCESINLEFESSFKLTDIRSILSNAPGIQVLDDIKNNLYAVPTIGVSGQDMVFVSRIRQDFSVKNGINIWVTADNIRKGAASNAVQILQYIINNRSNFTK